MESMPTSKIRSLAMGLVEIYGDVVPMSRTMKSPFTFLDCVYYRYTVQELRSSGKSSHWVTIKSGSDDCLFYLRDETGSVLVNPSGARIDIPADNHFQTRYGQDLPAGVKQFCVNNSFHYKSRLGFKKALKFTEWFIAPGDKLYVLGTAADNPYREDATAIDSVQDVMITKGTGNKTYYITDKPETAIVSRLTAFMVVGVVFGIVCIIGGLYLL